ncbi:hexameric tyrosine-coordinated heme protein [Aquimarina litoralis]|uniref:hexameric tyrosine-coordinated heme protein n=1 Tax=Aquimarina litoralis TaxID=584605 RepID=UPI001C55A86E|nr:hexameric tyrosine-coordinated heme protein [Aquimarina litoralis]MBW1294429.1 peroxidase [Aquimarina litoralis]
MNEDNLWLPSLITNNPQEGFELAIKLSQMGIKASNSNNELFKNTELNYYPNVIRASNLSQLIALSFHTIALANNYWK